MLYIEPKSTDAAFHFAVEDYCMKRFPPEESIMMLWQTGRCAMLGSNQIADAEIDLSLAESLEVQLVRRQSGGGTIFTDPGTLLYTVILPYRVGQDPKQLERDLVVAPMVRALNEMGVPAYPEGRNDILVDGKKVSGLAQHLQRNRLCTHGSMLYNANLDMLSAILKPDTEKIKTKSLRSVRSRVTNLAPYLNRPVPVREFWDGLKEKFLVGREIQEYSLTDYDLSAIHQIRREKYAHPDWMFGKSPPFSFHNHKRFPLGKVEVFLEIKRGLLASCRINGDFLGLRPIRELEELLEGKAYQAPLIEETLSSVNLRSYLGGITRDELLQCLFIHKEGEQNGKETKLVA